MRPRKREIPLSESFCRVAALNAVVPPERTEFSARESSV